MSKVADALHRLGSPSEVLEAHGYAVRRRSARCPFHEDRSPSLSLYRGSGGKERWRCHSCDIGGDAIDLEAMLTRRSVRDLL